LAGLDVEAKAKLVEEQLFGALGGRDGFAASEVTLVGSTRADPPTNTSAVAFLRIAVASPDRDRVGKHFSAQVVELMLASLPGIAGTAPPGDATSFATYWPTRVDSRHLCHRVTVDGETIEIAASVEGAAAVAGTGTVVETGGDLCWDIADTVRVPLG